jgi:DNA (cytosine-5)-methyltransferase 1
MTRLPKTIHAVDLFCGAGGTSTGLAQACKALGVDVDLVAINHWTTAVNSHAKNHPWARHMCVPVESVNPREAMPGGVVHILCASPECTHHSTARGGKPTSDQLRASAWHIMRWVNELDVRNILIENVPEFEGWGPVSVKTGRPIKRERGKYFRAFVDALSHSGYAVSWKVLNAADYGAATSRRRLFLVARKGKRVPAWPAQTHSRRDKKTGQPSVPGTKPWRAAREVIDWSLEGKSIFDREKPLADKTVQRILAGLEKHGGPALQPFLVLLRGGEAGRSSASVDGPVPTLTAGGEHVAVAEPFLLGQQSGGAPRAVSEPAPTIAAGGAVSLVEPVLVDTFGSKDTWGARGRSIAEPVPAVAGNGRWAVASPVLVPYYGTADGAPVASPLPTVTTVDRFGLVEPFIITTDRLDTNRSLPRPVSEPVPTIVASNDRVGLAEAFLVPNFGERDGQAPRTHSVHDPVPTVTGHGAGALIEPAVEPAEACGTCGHDYPTNGCDCCERTVFGSSIGRNGVDGLALVQPVVNGRKLDIRFRMLQPHELARAMGFPADYVFEGSRRDMVKQVGNAVEVHQSRALIHNLLTGGLNPQSRLDLAPQDAPEVPA